ncbi:hypothetical protein HYU82_02490 [Candidatus Saccharibacteria bacterium]|nr:hypothetical protein [Candidatus Saccharibacteria bacterium]
MVKRVKFSESSPESVLDVFEAIKRALIRRGIFRQKTETKKPASKKDKQAELATIARKSHEILFKANTVFPFTLFPDTVTLDREKVSFASRYFFSVAKVTSVPIRDILSVEADIGPFFGSVHTASRFFVTNPKSINWLRRSDAMRLQRLLQGYIIVQEQEIDCDKIKKEELVKLLNDLGTGRTG